MNIIKILKDRESNNITNIKNLQTFEPFIDRLELQAKLSGHEGCVNCLEFSSNGSTLASASDDLSVIIWNPYQNKQLISFPTPHRGNIFSVKFLPKTNDQQLVTGAADYCMYAFDLQNTDDPIFKCRCHQSRVKRIAVAPELPSTFFSSSEDGCVFQIDLREPHTCNKSDKIVMIDLKNHQESVEAKCIAINPRRPEQLAIGTSDAYARIYDRRMITLMANGGDTDNLSMKCVRYYAPGHLQVSRDNINKAVTYVSFSPSGTELMVNYGAEQIYLFDIDKSEPPIYLDLPKLAPEPPPKLPKNEKVDAIKAMGNDFLENEKYIQAIRQYSEALMIAPKNPVLYLNRATALMRRKYLGDYYEALRDCHQALLFDSHYIKAHFRLARALFEINQLAMSNDCLQELKRRFPSHETDQSVKMLEKDITLALNARTTTPNHHDSNPEKLSPNEILWRNDARDYKQRYIGHCNTKTDIKEANFFGQNGDYIIAGSDDGNFYIWDRKTCRLKSVYKADKAIVNCVQPHPFLPLIATSGIDHEIGLWSPQASLSEKYKINDELIDNLINENQTHMQSDSYEFGLGSENLCRTS